MLRPALALLSAGLLSAMVVTGCGVRFDDGPSVSSARSVAAFDRLEVQGSTDVDVRVGDHTSVVVRGPKDAVAEVHTVVRDGTLVVQRDHHDDDGPTLVLGGHHLQVDVVVPRLTAVAVDGSGDIDAAGAVRSLRASVQGSGDLDLTDLRIEDTLEATIDGSGDIDYAGHPKVVSDLDGPGDLSRDD